MKTKLWLLLFFLMFSVISFGQEVYVTKTGTKYHKITCTYLKQSSIKMELDNAINENYTPCSRCKPITVKDTSVNSTTINDETVPTIKNKTYSTSSQCNGITKKGKRCKRMVKGGGNCYQH